MAQAKIQETGLQSSRNLNLSKKTRGNGLFARIKTAYRSFMVLKGLKQGQVDAFLASYATTKGRKQ